MCMYVDVGFDELAHLRFELALQLAHAKLVRKLVPLPLFPAAVVGRQAVPPDKAARCTHHFGDDLLVLRVDFAELHAQLNDLIDVLHSLNLRSRPHVQVRENAHDDATTNSQEEINLKNWLRLQLHERLRDVLVRRHIAKLRRAD